MMIDTSGTWVVPPDQIARIIWDHFDMRPKAIIHYLDLLRPIYKMTACYGHFGRNEPELKWESTHRAEELRKAAGL
jgi:S-adenosylmethionine synthetase